MDADALVPMALRRDHDISLVEHEKADFLWVDEFILAAPIQERAWGPDNNLLLELGASLLWTGNGKLRPSNNLILSTSIVSTNSIR